MSRYDALLRLIDKYKPESIIEIGVWNGANAIRIINQALKYHPAITYTGYDLFEDATSETDTKEFNVKGHNSAKAVAAYIRAETGITPTIIKGDTNETLKLGTVVDFVFLDGGHSIETIANDYAMVQGSKVIVLDDYYTPDERGESPDINIYGCNQLLKTIAKYEVIPDKDRVRGGGFTQLVVVEHV